MNVTCPECQSQEMSITLTSESELFAAATIGKAIIGMEEILRGVAANMGSNVGVFLSAINLAPKTVTIRFRILSVSQ